MGREGEVGKVGWWFGEYVLGNILELHLRAEGLAGGGSEFISGCEHGA